MPIRATSLVLVLADAADPGSLPRGRGLTGPCEEARQQPAKPRFKRPGRLGLRLKLPAANARSNIGLGRNRHRPDVGTIGRTPRIDSRRVDDSAASWR
jgi:hypothetical protein